MAEQEKYYEFGPTHIINIGWYLLPILSLPIVGASIFLLIPILFALYKYLEVRSWRYQIYEDRIVERKGVFDVTYEEMRYFRIKSIMSEEPFWMRLIGVGNIKVISSEEFKPTITLYAIDDREKFVEFLQEVTTEWRKEMGVKEYDLHNL